MHLTMLLAPAFAANVATAFFAIMNPPELLYFTMNGDLLEEGIILLALETLGSVLLVLSGDIPRHSGYAAFFLLSALEDDLHPVTF